MGAQESKPLDPNTDENSSNSLNKAAIESVPSTPILTPLDPRSPSANIARTPLETILGVKVNHVSNSSQVEESPKIILGIDPRSPTIEFDRTPIVVPANTRENNVLHNKNLDNVRKTLLQVTPVKTLLKPPNIVPPKLLESSPIVLLPTSETKNKRKSFVGLLETNLDFTETDLDAVSRLKESLNKTISGDVSEVSITPLSNKLKNQMEALNIEPQKLTSEFDESAEQMLDEAVEKSAEVVEPEIIEEITVALIEEKSINVTAHVKDFDQKLTNLIYEDEIEVDVGTVMKVAKIKENNRTPLGARNGNFNECRKSNNNKLKVSDKPRKSDIVSRIPVSKHLGGKKAIQCENTPPRKFEEKKLKPKISQWDADKTLII